MNAIAHAPNAPSGPQLDNRRVLAGIIDLAIIAAAGLALSFVAATVMGGEVGLSARVALIMVGCALYYYFALESGNGQTVGKKVMKLRVVRADGAPPGMRDIAVRTIVRLIDGPLVPLIGLIAMMATGDRRQRLGDLAAGTMVADASAEPAGAATQATAVAAPPEPAPEPELDEEPESVAAHAPVEPEPVPVEPEPVAAEPGPVADEPQPEPVAVEPLPEPVAAEPEPGPVADEPQPEPVAVEPLPEPVADEPQPEQPTPPPAAPDYSPPAVTDFDPYSMTQPVEPTAGPGPADEPQPAEQPAVERAPVADPGAEQPASEERSEVPTPEESLAALMGTPPSQPAGASEENGAPQQEPEQDVNVRSVETVSAIDLVMGGDDEQDDAADDNGPQPQVQ